MWKIHYEVNSTYWGAGASIPKGNESELPPCFVLLPPSLSPIPYRPIFPPLSKKLTWEIRSPLLFQWIIPIHGYYGVDAPEFKSSNSTDLSTRSYLTSSTSSYWQPAWLQPVDTKDTSSPLDCNHSNGRKIGDYLHRDSGKSEVGLVVRSYWMMDSLNMQAGRQLKNDCKYLCH